LTSDKLEKEDGLTVKRIGIELKTLSNLVMRYMENNSNKKTVDKITGRNAWIIAYLDRNSDRDVYQRDLEKEFGITRSTASKVVNLMVQKDLIERQSVSQDARLKKMVLTEKANEIAKLMKEDGDRLECRLTEGFSENELGILFSFIERMKSNME
jgi:DNA-binding MarR family transcriptional regulator